MFRRARILGPVIVAVGLTGALLGLPAPLAGAATRTAKATATVTKADSTTLRVAWSSTAAADHWVVRLDDVATGKPATRVTACGTCREARITDAVAGRSYRATVWPVDRAGKAGATITSSNLALADTLCGTDLRTVCTAVDARRRIEPMAHRAGGLNGGWDAVTTAAWKVDVIAPTSARVEVHTDAATWAELKRRAIPTTYMVDSWWRTQREALTQSILPWDDFTLYRAELARLAKGFVAAGTVPDYWEIANEPDVLGVYGAVIPTRDQLLAQYKAGYEAIRSVLPTAKIIGPSLQGFFWDAPTRSIDLKSFIAFADANNLQFAGISWHENGVEGDLDDLWASSGRSIAAHVQRVKVALAATTNLKAAKLHVNEVVPAWMSAVPGGMLGWMTYAEGSGAEQIGLTCWDTPNDPGPGLTNPLTGCGLGTFDGLYHSNGNPTATAWPHYQYRTGLTGWRVDSRTNQLGWSSLATVRDDGTVNALIGRSESCRADVNPHCTPAMDRWLRARPGWFAAGAAADAKVVVGSPLAAGRKVTVTATRYTPVNTSYAKPITPAAEVRLAATVARNGTVTVTLPKVIDGDAWLVTVAPTA